MAGFGFHTIAHLAGDIASPVLNGFGAETGINQLTNLGHAIGSPTATLSNPGGLFTTDPAFTQGPAPGYVAPKAQDNSPAPAPTPTTNNTGTTYTDSAGNKYTSQAQADASNQAIDQINGNLGRLPGQLDIARGNIQGQFNTNQNEINSGEQQAQGQYNQSTNQNHQQYVTNKNGIQDQASAGLHGLLRLLGMHGAGGSSDYLQAAPQAVAQQATQQRAGAGQTFGQNQQGLDTNWNNYETGVGTAKQKLNDWLSSQLNSAQATSDQARQGLLQKLAGLQPSVAASQPFVDQINGLQDQVDQLGKLNPTYSGNTPTYTAPSVASYTVNPTAAPQVASNALDNVSSPYLGMLLGNLKDKNQQQQPAF